MWMTGSIGPIKYKTPWLRYQLERPPNPQYPDRAQVVGRSTVKIQPKTAVSMVSQLAVPPQQATEPGNKDDEPRFSMWEVQHLLEYTMAAQSVSDHNEGQGYTTGS